MAQQEYESDLSAESYFNERLSDGSDPVNPFEVQESEHKSKKGGSRSKKGKKKPLLTKRVLVIAAIVLILILALVIFILVQRRKNNGARYAKLLSQNIGLTLDAAQRKADITMQQESAYTTLNTLFASYQALAESKKSCRIQGVRLPEWAIFCNTNVDELINVTYYNYEVLEKNVFGTERKAYIDPNLAAVGSSVEQTETYLGLTPYRIQYLQGQQQLREYRYCYEDKDTGDVVSYVITAIWDENGALSSIVDNRKNYIGTLLSSPEM